MERERLAEEAHRQVIVAVAAVGRQRGSRIKRVKHPSGDAVARSQKGLAMPRSGGRSIRLVG